MKRTDCSQCGKAFDCGHPGTCWCSQLPQIIDPHTASSCLCRDCLIKEQHKKLRGYLQSHSIEEAVQLLEPFREDDLVEDLDYTVENGLWIFKPWYLIRRGYCCNQDCSHCPY